MKHSHLNNLSLMANSIAKTVIATGFDVSSPGDFVTSDPIKFCQAVQEEKPLHVHSFNLANGDLCVSALWGTSDNSRPFINLQLQLK